MVAHLTGGQGVVGSNPAIPTEMSQVRGPHRFGGAGLRLAGEPKFALDEHGRWWQVMDAGLAAQCLSTTYRPSRPRPGE